MRRLSDEERKRLAALEANERMYLGCDLSLAFERSELAPVIRSMLDELEDHINKASVVVARKCFLEFLVIL